MATTRTKKAPRTLVQSWDKVLPASVLARELATVKFPDRLDDRMQRLMDRNSEGTITSQEREELDAMVNLSTFISLFKARAMGFISQIRRESPRKAMPAVNGHVG